MDWLDTARELIATESITGNEEPVTRVLERRLEALGFSVESDEVELGRRNIYAGPKLPSVVLCTHTDTVPPFVPLREDEHYLYGRGACDTKGIAACFLEAARRLLESGFRDFGLLFVVGEEVNNAGARAAHRLVRGRHVVIGEPTENCMAVGHKGVLALSIRARGLACHSAYPELGKSALHPLLRGLARALDEDFGTHPVLGPALINVGVLRGGAAGNVLAAEADAKVWLRVVGSIDEAERRLRACLSVPGAESIEIEILSRMPPILLTTLEGFPETVVGYGTDAPFLRDVGMPLLYGPGSIHDAHTDHERISKASMARAVDDYVGIVRRLARGDGIKSPRYAV
jgi:acetylornithine deacetylase